jgi:hypothetical protein
MNKILASQNDVCWVSCDEPVPITEKESPSCTPGPRNTFGREGRVSPMNTRWM